MEETCTLPFTQLGKMYSFSLHYRIWTPRSWWCVWMWRHCTWSSAEDRQGWWWASGGICRMGSPKNTGQGPRLVLLQKREPSTTVFVQCIQQRATHPHTERPHKTKGTHPTHTHSVLHPNTLCGLHVSLICIFFSWVMWWRKSQKHIVK